MKPIWAGLAFALVACGSGDVTSSSTTATTVASTTTVATLPSTTTTTSIVATTTLPLTTTQVSESTTTTASGELPGEPVDFGPAAGDVLAVVGVAHDDVLNLRAAPGAGQQILAGIPPLHEDLVALGQTRELPRSFWIEVDYEGTEGWVNLRYTGYLGETQEGSPELMEGFSGADMVELGMTVAEAFGYDRADVVVVAAPTAANPDEVTLDLLGLEDDSLRGQRAHIVGERVDGRFSVDSMETTAICARGVDGDGFCV